MTNKDLIDWALCVERAANKADLARDMLIQVVVELDDFQELIAQQNQSGDNRALQATVHKLHGMLCYTGMPRLKQQCQALEQTLTQSPNAPVNTPVADLLNTITQIQGHFQTHHETVE